MCLFFLVLPLAFVYLFQICSLIFCRTHEVRVCCALFYIFTTSDRLKYPRNFCHADGLRGLRVLFGSDFILNSVHLDRSSSIPFTYNNTCDVRLLYLYLSTHMGCILINLHLIKVCMGTIVGQLTYWGWKHRGISDCCKPQ